MKASDNYRKQLLDIKIKNQKCKALANSATWFYKTAQNLKLYNSLGLIDAKNAMEQALEPYQEMAIACTSPLANATN